MDLKIHFYYLYDMCTCSDLDQTQFLMNPFYKKDKHIFYTKISQTGFGVIVGDFIYSLATVIITWKIWSIQKSTNKSLHESGSFSINSQAISCSGSSIFSAHNSSSNLWYSLILSLMSLLSTISHL